MHVASALSSYPPHSLDWALFKPQASSFKLIQYVFGNPAHIGARLTIYLIVVLTTVFRGGHRSALEIIVLYKLGDGQRLESGTSLESKKISTDSDPDSGCPSPNSPVYRPLKVFKHRIDRECRLVEEIDQYVTH